MADSIEELPHFYQRMTIDALKKANKRARQILIAEALQNFQQDPVGFTRQVFGDTLYPDTEALMESVRDYPITIAKSATGVGKCVAEEERIVLADGRVIEAKELVGRSFVIPAFSKSGSQVPSVAWATDNGTEPVYRITTKEGREIIRTGNHPLWACVIERKRGSVLSKKPDWIKINDLDTSFAVALPNCINVDGRRRRSEDEIKLAAYLIGDGGTTVAIIFTQQDGPAKNEFIDIVEKMGCITYRKDKYTVRVVGDKDMETTHDQFEIGRNPVLNLARDWGLFGKKSSEKSFPDWIWELPNDQIALFLSRLFSCDGWAYSPSSGIKQSHNQIGYSSTSEKLIRDVELAMLRLGIPGRVRRKATTCNGKKFYSWEWAVCTTDTILDFCNKMTIFGKDDRVEKCRQVALSRGKHKVKWRYNNIPDGYRWDEIKSIEYVGNLPTVAITVPKHGAYITTFVEHNSFTAARIACWYFLVYKDSQIFVTAAPPLENLQNILWGQIMSVVGGNGKWFRSFKKRVLYIERNSLSFLTGVTIPIAGTPEERESKFSGKHAPHLLFIVDEGDAVAEEIFKGIDGCMSNTGARLLIMFNPKAQRGPVYDMERDGRANIINLSAFNHPNVISGHEVIPGAVTREKTIERINEWSRPMVDDEATNQQVFTVPSFLVGQTTLSSKKIPYDPLPAGKRIVIDPALSYKVLGIYPSQSIHQLIDAAWVEAAFDRWRDYVSTYGEKPPSTFQSARLGVDVAEFGTDDNVSYVRYDNYVIRRSSWRGVDADLSADRALREYKLHSCTLGFIDATGYGSGIAPKMNRSEKGIRAFSVKVSGKVNPAIRTDQGEFYQLRDQLWWACREWLRTQPAMLPPYKPLREELTAARYEFRLSDGKIKISDKKEFRSVLGRSPNDADALCLTFYPLERAKIVTVGIST